MNKLNNIETFISIDCIPLEYKIIEWRLIINRELFESNIIDNYIFCQMENYLLSRLAIIKNNFSKINE